MIVTIAGYKGGCGKTTVAVHLAAYFGNKNSNTLLIDGDPNRSALGWSQRGQLPFDVCDLTAAQKQSEGRSHLILDTEAHPSSEQMKFLAEGCDLMVLPTSAQALSLEAAIKTAARLPKKTNYRILLNMIDARKTTALAGARSALQKSKIPTFNTVIRSLSAYEKASLMGVPVYASGDRLAQSAWSEFEALGQEIEELLS